jgi:hypothetical protein
MDTFERLDAVFDVPGVPSESTAVTVPEATQAVEPVKPSPFSVTAADAESVIQDVDRARDTIHELIDKGLEATDKMLAIASQSDHPRAFEVTSQLINTTAALAKDLLEIQKRSQSLKEGPKQTSKDNESKGPITNNTMIFAGTTRELMEAMRKARVAEVLPEES